MHKGTNVYVKSVCESKLCSCKSCKICQQKKLSLQCFTDTDDATDRQRGKKKTADKSQLCKKDSLKITSCECRKCTCDICAMNKSKKNKTKKVPSNSSDQAFPDPEDICDRHRGRKKETEPNPKTILKCPDVKKPSYKFSKSLPPSPTASKHGRKLPKLKQHCDCKECNCDRCTHLYNKPLSLHTLADPEYIYDRHYRVKSKSSKSHVQPICDCIECLCDKCKSQMKQISLHSFTAKQVRHKKIDECPLCLQIIRREKKSHLARKPSSQICDKLCEKKPKQSKTETWPPCDCKDCQCRRCKDIRKKTTPSVKFTNASTDTDDICEKHRGRKIKTPGECRLCLKLQETRQLSILNVLNPDRPCNCEVVANAVGSMKYDLASIHPLQF